MTDRPPLYATFRVNPSTFNADELKLALGPHASRLQFHPELKNVAIVPCDTTDVNPVGKFVIVGAECGNAVLRGADVFAPGVLTMDYTLFVNDETSVFADRHSKVVRGCKLTWDEIMDNDRFVFCGNGKLLMSRDQLFNQSKPGSINGVCVSMTQKLFNLPSLNTVLPHMIYPQNFPSLICAHVLAPRGDDMVLDMCAAPGGKTGHVASIMRQDAERSGGCVVAIDRTTQKVDKIVQHCEAWELSNVECYSVDSSKPIFVSQTLSNSRGQSRLMEPEMFDKILLDAPCSGLGKRPYIQKSFVENSLGKFHGFQRKFIKNAVQLLKPGGRIVYSTCTTDLEENENQIAWVLEQYPGMELVACEPNFRKSGRNESRLSEENLSKVQFFPAGETDRCAFHACESDTIGFFIATLRKFQKI